MEYEFSSSENEEDNEGLLKQALEVKLTDFNPNSVPQDGYEFIQHVIYERKRCKKVVKSNINPDNYVKNQTLSVLLEKPAYEQPLIVPTTDWQYRKLTEFQDYRSYLHSVLGDNQSIVSFNEEAFKSEIVHEQPCFSKLCKLSQAVKIRMFGVIIKYLDNIEPGLNIPNNLGIWIFALLALLDIPLSPNDCYVIREFGKRCLAIRSKLLVSDVNCGSELNFFICVVGRFYNQLDLADK